MNSKTIARYGIIAALVAVGIVIDTLISAFTPVTIAAATLIIVLTICQSFDLKTAVFASTVFGILSLIRSYTIPNFISPAMQNPLISVLPRICIGFTCHLSLVGFKKIIPKKDFRLYLPYILSGAIGVITNTGLVLTMMLIFDQTTLTKVIATILALNFWIEFLCAVLIVPTISRVTIRAKRNVDNKNDTIVKKSNNKKDTAFEQTEKPSKKIKCEYCGLKNPPENDRCKNCGGILK